MQCFLKVLVSNCRFPLLKRLKLGGGPLDCYEGCSETKNVINGGKIGFWIEV